MDLVKEILTRLRDNIGSYRPLLLTYQEMNRIKHGAEDLVSWFTPNIHGHIQCNGHFDIAAASLKSHFMCQTKGDGWSWRPGAYTWVKYLAERELFVEVAAYLLAASMGPQSAHESKCYAFRSQLLPLVENMLLSYPEVCAYHHPAFSLVYNAETRWKEAIEFQKSILAKYTLKPSQHSSEANSISKLLTSTYCNIGRWRDAAQHLSTLLSHQEDTLGELHVKTMCTMHDLALALSRLDRWEDAECLLKRVWDGRTQALGDSHPDTLSAIHSVASVYSGQGRWQEAQELHDRGLQTRRKVLGEHHADTLSSMHSLATTQALGDSHPDTLLAIHSVASVYSGQGRWQEAQELHDRALQTRRKVLGEHHADTLSSMHSLATTHQSTVAAEALNKQVLEARKKALGSDHPDTLSSMYALALVYRRQRQRQEAVRLAESVLEAQEMVLSRDHVDTIQTMRTLASWYLQDDSLPYVVALHKRILESRRAVYGDNSPVTHASMDELVSIYWKQRLYARAEDLHLELLEARRRALGDSDPVCLGTSLELATHFLIQCRWREASVLLRKVLEIKMQDQDLERNDPEIKDIQQQLGLTLAALSLDVFVVSPEVPMESVVAHFTGRASLKDYSAQLQDVPQLPTTPIDGGGFANIYRVTLQDSSVLAVKCIKGAQGEYKQVKQTIRELSTWSHLRHKSIVPLLGLALFRGQLAMVSPWNKRGNVMKYILQHPDVDRFSLCKQVVNAVVYLHTWDFVHGDLKGSNILVSDDGTLQLTDFGLTIMHDAMIRFSRSSSVTGGTLRWMAPELLLGNETGNNTTQASQCLSDTLTKITDGGDDSEAKLCKETDIYALGMTMLELLTGKPPFKEIKKDTAVIVALSQGRRPSCPKRIMTQSTQGPGFWEIMKKCWAEIPADRPIASEVELMIQQLANS
ncbi:kinase-like protein [Ceratobasidium sp. AG-I]|nr:kinase-like protein [Ceratobasidium sp. AG-I]